MVNTTLPNRHLLLMTLGLTYITIGMLGALPGASLIRLASNTHVSLEVAGSMFTISAFGSMLGIVLSGFLVRSIQPKYLLMLGLFLLGSGSTAIALTSLFPVLLLGQMVIGLGFGFLDPSLNTVATLTFQERLASDLNTLHGLFGLGSLLGPLVLAFGLHLFNSLELSYFAGAGVAAITILLILLQRIPELPRQAMNVLQQRAANSEQQNVLRQGFLWLMVLQVSIFAAAEIGFGNWIVTAVSQSAALSLAQAAPVATAFFLGLTAGRLGGAQLLRRGWMSEASLLYAALCGGVLCGTIVAMFSGQVLVSYVASALVGCFYGPLEPGMMAITSRRFVHAIGPVSSILIISTNATSMIVPAAMGLLIPALGINWVMAIPALCCAFAVFPMALTNRAQPGAQTDHHDG
ncbi:MAG: MFS transporter [Chloroflexi bacterium]|nr:MAG: MFS transporter [Chloroflexota bacterium]